MYQLSFNFHGVKVNLTAGETNSRIAAKALEKLSEDFRYFLEPSQQNFEIELRLIATPYICKLPDVPLFKTRMCRAFGFRNRRLCDYGDGSLVESFHRKRGRRVFNVYSQNESELYEFAYVALLSAVGEALDRRGFHRVHALGISNATSSFLVFLPQGGGKSTLAATFLKKGIPISVLSDESPLIKDGIAYPFPTHIALTSELSEILGPKHSRLFRRKYFPSKNVFEIPKEKISGPKPIGAVLIGRRSNEPAQIIPLPKWKAFLELFKSIVIGVGLAQMAEFMIRGNNIFGLVRIGYLRFAEFNRALRLLPCYEFVMGPDILENAHTLQNFVRPEAKHELAHMRESQEVFNKTLL